MTKSIGFRALLWRWGCWLIMIGLCVIAQPVFATMWYQSGIAGPVVVHDGRVYFAQADETLTVLDLASGKVLHRLTSGPSGVRVRGCDAGLLVTDWNQLYLLDWSTLKKRWVISTEDYIPYIEAVRPGMVLLSDNQAVYAVDTKTGKRRWSLNGYAGYITIEQDRAMIFQSADTFADSKAPDKLFLVEIETGEVLRQHAIVSPADQQRSFSMSGDEIYAIDQSRHDVKNISVYRVSSDGQLQTIKHEQFGEEFYQYVRIGERYFDTNGYPTDERPVGHANFNKPVPEFVKGAFKAFDESLSAVGASPFRLRIEDNGSVLRLIVPHLRAGEDSVPSFTLTDEVLLLSTARGQVECLDRATGASRWLYVSPWSPGMISHTGGHVINVGSLIREFDAEKTDHSKRTPTMVVRSETGWSLSSAEVSPDAVVIEDPSPFNPYQDLRDLWWMMRLSPLIYALLIFAVLYTTWRMSRPSRRWLGVACAILFCVPAPLLIYFCGFSLAGSAALIGMMMLLGSLALWYAITEVKRREIPIVAVSLIPVFIAVWWVWPVFNFVKLIAV
ncbi:MAG: PQQ-binding-like beta-propeller repeat protein [Phycisphaeraceae bacterium]